MGEKNKSVTSVSAPNSPTKIRRFLRKPLRITWSFRFSTLRKNKMQQPVINNNSPHIAIERWLEQLDLSQYQENFKQYNGVEELLSLSEADIKQMGVRNSAHRARMVSNLLVLREKYHQAKNGVGNTNSLRPRPKPSSPQCRPPSDPGTGYSRDAKSSSPQDRRSIGAKSSVALTKDQEDPSVYEALNVKGAAGDSKQSKSCGDLVDMDPAQAADIQEAIALKKALEWELSLDSRDLRSHAWYHGTIPRQRAEEIVQKEGDFLIRDCASQPGNYVLTCRTKSSVLHFVINKILIQPETVYERVQYQFEDDAYDTVPDLITFYVGSGKPISAASGARIQYPCNRAYPLSYYATKYGIPYNTQSPCGIRGASPLNSPSLASAGLRFSSYTQQTNGNNFRSPMSSPPRTKRDTPPRLPSKKQRSQSLTPVQAAVSSSVQSVEKYCSADGMIQTANIAGPPAHLNEARRIISSGNERSCSADGMIQQQNGSGRDIMVRSIEEKCTSADGVISNQKSCAQMMSRSTEDPSSHLKFSSHSLPRPMSGNLRLASSRTSSLNRDTSDTSLSPCLEQNQFAEGDSKAPSPPPKPSRVPSKREYVRDFPVDPLNRIASYHASGSDSGNGSGDSAQSSAAGDALDSIPHRGVIIKNPRFMTNSASSMTLRSFSEFDVAAVEHILATADIPSIEMTSRFDLENFQTLLLPTVENKPLDNGALNTLRMMLAETGPRIIAQHLTRVDLYLFLGDLDNSAKTPSEKPAETSPLDCTGLELLTLSHGETFRHDLIERTQCLKFIVAVTILICQSDLERAETLNKWIQVAVDTKTALGNLFGFCAIMLGICMPQIQQLERTWHILRQKFTDSAFTFEAKLRPTLKSMNDCSNPQAPNTTVPHVLPYILLKDRGIEDVLMNTNFSQSSSLMSSCINSWEHNADDFGISILFAHLDAARSFTKNLPLYKRNAQMVIDDSNARFDELLLEAFKTEFHMKFLWGSKGALSPDIERHKKMEDLLTLMAKKFGSGDHITCAT
ncbi:unnamed protein product [Hermetia illucens]|uniref:Breast cancer anti-estrogen resistance protein 3 homolog n=2 Tax=Hermetia illucens TaxID=343691 RepID=A0A7R8US72_HERIL|nr:breast cancer anti-estrogen resistance protein 3 homolog isoform X1 [Hermetia illucens]CAD7085603.1 unnamed protein product [Hermetia illucens]